MFIRVVSTGQAAAYYTRCTMDFHGSLDTKVTISPRHIFWKIAKLFGASEVEISDYDFSRKYIVRSKFSDFAGALITPETARLLMELKNTKVVLKNDTGFIERNGYVRKREMLEKLITTLAAIMSRVEDLAESRG